MKQVYRLQTAVAFTAIVFLSGCSKSGSNPQPQNNNTLSISSLDVNTGPYTTRVTITGKGFGATPSEDHVSFNGHAATLESVSATQIIADVPLSAGTGNVTVTVNNKTATGPVFTYQIAEVVTSIAGSFNGVGSANGNGASATFNQPSGLATDASGNIYVADQGNDLIRKITPDGTVSTVAGSGQSGHADGAAMSASFAKPYGIVLDAPGNIYVADASTGLIRKITPAGQVSTIAGNISSNQPADGTGTAASFSRPAGLAIDAPGNLFLADQGAGQIRKITPAGDVTTIFKGSSIDPYQLVLDKDGNIYTADASGNNILKITQAGVLSVFAGNGGLVGGSNDGAGNQASFSTPYGITIDGSGNLLVIDRGNDLIRQITPGAVVTTLGNHGVGINQYGPVAHASFVGVFAITVDKTGNIYFVANNEIRKISMQ